MSKAALQQHAAAFKDLMHKQLDLVFKCLVNSLEEATEAHQKRITQTMQTILDNYSLEGIQKILNSDGKGIREAVKNLGLNVEAEKSLIDGWTEHRQEL